ncbi:MAG: TerD family protein [Clostridia bacterium]|jgi:stress response protein SCP2|nr:TerD family protein [Clostridia bacterium]
MSVNLQKGQKVDLTKGNSKLRRVMIGLGWDESTKPSGGGLAGLFGGGKKQSVDCDASAFLCGAGGKLKDKGDIIYFGNLQHTSRCVKHMGDNLTGAGEGDDEQIWVDILDMPEKYEKIVFVVNIYQARERKQHFGMIKNAFIRVVDADTNQELYKYNLSENYENMTAMIFGEVYRHGGDWKFNAIGQATTDNGIGEVANRLA